MALEKRITCDCITGKTKEETFTFTPMPVTEVKKQKIAEIKQKAKTELDATDYKVIRHRDQVAAAQTMSITDTQYKQLLADRQAVRDRSNVLEAQVNAATTVAEVNAIVW